MSDYTTTPVLGLFKPTPNADVGQWGTHWNQNADTLDTSFSGLNTSLPYLPLAGGAMTGAITALGPSTLTATGANTVRSLANRFADLPNVKDFGAVLNGTTLDTTAFQAARNATTSDGIIFVPPGGFNVGTITAPANDYRLWWLSGNKVGTGTGVVNYAGADGDTTLTMRLGRFAVDKQNLTTDSFAAQEINTNFAFVASGAAGVRSGLRVGAQVGNNNNLNSVYYWGVNSVVSSTDTNFNAQHVGVAGTTTKNASGAKMWAGFFQSLDTTGLPAATSGGMTGCEIDLSVNDLDSSPSSSRTVLSLRGNKQTTSGVDAEIGQGIFSSAGTGAKFRINVRLTGAYSQAAISTREAVGDAGSNALWLATGQTIGFDTAGTGGASNSQLSSSGTILTLAGNNLNVTNGFITAGNNSLAVAAQLTINAAVQHNRIVMFQTAGQNRWAVYTDGTAEGGSNAGSNFAIARYDDTGTNIVGNPISIARATGTVTIGVGGLILPLLTNAANDAAAASAGVAVGQLYRNASVVMQRVA